MYFPENIETSVFSFATDVNGVILKPILRISCLKYAYIYIHLYKIQGNPKMLACLKKECT